MKSGTLILVALLGPGSAAVHAACDTGLADRMNARLHPQRTLDETRAACKAWPGIIGRSIVVLPLLVPGSSPASPEYDIEVLVVQQADNGNTERSTVTHRIFEERALLAEAKRIDDIRIDTARMSLAPEVRAFGIRIRYSGLSRTRPTNYETLSLYVPQPQQKLWKVLDEVEISSDRGEWDTMCNGAFDQVRSSLSVAPTRSNGWSDLLLQSTYTSSRSSLNDGSCIEQPRPARFVTTVLRFDGRRFAVPSLTPPSAALSR